MAIMHPASGQIVHAISKEGPDHIVPNWPRSDLDSLVRFWPKYIRSGSKPVCKNPRAWFLAECSWPTISFSLSDFVVFFHKTAWIILCINQPGSDLVLADCVRFWPSRSDPEASRIIGGSCHKYHFCRDKHLCFDKPHLLS